MFHNIVVLTVSKNWLVTSYKTKILTTEFPNWSHLDCWSANARLAVIISDSAILYIFTECAVYNNMKNKIQHYSRTEMEIRARQ